MRCHGTICKWNVRREEAWHLLSVWDEWIGKIPEGAKKTMTHNLHVIRVWIEIDPTSAWDCFFVSANAVEGVLSSVSQCTLMAFDSFVLRCSHCLNVLVWPFPIATPRKRSPAIQNSKSQAEAVYYTTAESNVETLRTVCLHCMRYLNLVYNVITSNVFVLWQMIIIEHQTKLLFRFFKKSSPQCVN